MNRNDQQFMAQKIRERYTAPQTTDLDALRALDAKVSRPAAVFAYIYGSISAIIMGAGMSLVMTDIAEMIGLGGDMMLPGILIGVAGMALAALTYPIYKGILNVRKRKYGAEILKLSEKIINQ
ncbi:MAG: hypothetical protein IJW29_09280 [Clostridia bacterium]|nr:hypothetical protein [Clostridia bacterium]MBQ9785682.1 hypothetical protein [Clostridia bacterium]